MDSSSESSSPGPIESKLVGDMGGGPDVKDTRPEPDEADMGLLVNPSEKNINSQVDHADMGEEVPSINPVVSKSAQNPGTEIPGTNKTETLPKPKRTVADLRNTLSNMQPGSNTRKGQFEPSFPTKQTETIFPQTNKAEKEFLQPKNDIEKFAFETFKAYFGDNWAKSLKNNLLISVRSANNLDWLRAQSEGAVGQVSTTAETRLDNNQIVTNHIVIFKPTSEYALRTEIGESIYNILENIALTDTLPTSEGKPLPAFLNLLNQGSKVSDLVEFSKQILDKWNVVYTKKPARYAGMNPDSTREFKGIPEWKSEGFSDGIAIEIKRRSGQPLTSYEQNIWNEYNYQAQNVIVTTVDYILPTVVKTR